MEKKVIRDEDGKGVTFAFYSTDFEFINPIDYYANHEIEKVATIEKQLLFMKNSVLASQLDDDFFSKRAVDRWNEKYKEIIATDIPENFIKLLGSASKKDQVGLMKGQSINPDQFIAFIFKAWEMGYSFSQYTSEHHHKGLNKKELPKLIHVNDDGTVKKVGETTLTDGQLRQVIEQRKVIVAKFFDNGNEWHCLFLTFNSIAGKESWKGGQAHLHYISDKYGISREEAVNRFKSGDYPSTSVHIDLLDYGNQTI